MDNFDFEAEEAAFQNLRLTLKLFAAPDSVERCKDGPGFFLVRWVEKYGWGDGGIGYTQESDYFETVEELVTAATDAINKRANDKFVAAAEDRERERKRW